MYEYVKGICETVSLNFRRKVEVLQIYLICVV